jgi:putative acetyltransferase
MNRNKQSVTVRMAGEKDAVSMAEIYYNTVRIINSKDYSYTRIEAWSGPTPDPEMWKLRLKNKITFIACLCNEIAGFVEFEPDGNIDAFYVHHNHQGKGVATELLKHVEREGFKHRVSKFYLEASITARPFFKTGDSGSLVRRWFSTGGKGLKIIEWKKGCNRMKAFQRPLLTRIIWINDKYTLPVAESVGPD